MLTTDTFTHDENAATDDEQQWNSQSNSNHQDYQQREAICDWRAQTDGKCPVQKQADKSYYT